MGKIKDPMIRFQESIYSIKVIGLEKEDENP